MGGPQVGMTTSRILVARQGPITALPGSRHLKVIYTASATVTGEGRNGHGRTSDGLLDVDLASPKELGGAGGATNPEQLFAVGYAACFHSALKVVGRREKVDLDGRGRGRHRPEGRRRLRAAGRAHGEPAERRPGGGRPHRGRRAPGLPVLERDPRQHRRDGARDRPLKGVTPWSELIIRTEWRPVPSR